MVVQLRDITPDEFVSMVLSEERDLTRLRLPEGSGFDDEQITSMRQYIEAKYLEYIQDPLNISGSRLIQVSAPRLYLPYVVAKRTDLVRANLRGANLRGAYLGGAYLGGADLEGADLRGVKKLDKALDLGYAIFKDTIVTEAEMAIIKPMLERPFDVREEQNSK